LYAGGDFDELYRTSRDRLVVQIAALTGDPTEARDFVQEAFVRAWIKWDRISAYEDPEGWVRRVAYRLAVGRWRRSRRLLLRPDVQQEGIEFPGEQAGVIDACNAYRSLSGVRSSFTMFVACRWRKPPLSSPLRWAPSNPGCLVVAPVWPSSLTNPRR
jgi:predicted RNA polymerase sigma factor